MKSGNESPQCRWLYHLYDLYYGSSELIRMRIDVTHIDYNILTLWMCDRKVFSSHSTVYSCCWSWCVFLKMVLLTNCSNFNSLRILFYYTRSYIYIFTYTELGAYQYRSYGQCHLYCVCQTQSCKDRNRR